jgi:hypothetical protein
MTAKTYVAQGPPPKPTVNPVREDTLIGTTELSSTGEHTASVNPHREIVRKPVLERELLARKLGRPIE